MINFSAARFRAASRDAQGRPCRLTTTASCQGSFRRAQAACTAVTLGWMTTRSAPMTFTTRGPMP